MKLLDSIKLASSVLRANKIRSFLTSLGIIIGIASVIVIMSVGAGAQSLIINQINTVGTNLVGILPGASDGNGPPASALGIVITTLKYEDAVAIKKNVANVSAATSYNTGIGSMSYQNVTIDSSYYGVMSDYLAVEDAEVSQGRFFTDEEDKSSDRVVVLGDKVYQELFDGSDPIGQKIKIKKEFFTVIGVMKSRGVAGFENKDDQVLIPSETAQKIMLGINYVNYIRVKVNSDQNIAQATEDIRLLLRDRHNLKPGSQDDFSVRNTKDAIQILTTVTNALKFFLTAIAAISLIVGGVGVMNIMLAAVNERTREIGLRMAVGARRSNIVIQFVSETVAMTIFGGVVGIILGSLISFMVAIVARYLGYNWALVVTPSSIISGFTVAAAIGLIFGVYPAQRASKLDPLSALRHE